MPTQRLTWHSTFATHRRRPVFADPDVRRCCAEALAEASERNRYRVRALAIMPDHVHLVHDAGDSEHPIARVMNNLKGVAARRVFSFAPELKLDLMSEHLWTPGYYSRVLFGQASVATACAYVRSNPLQVGLPEQVYPWVVA